MAAIDEVNPTARFLLWFMVFMVLVACAAIITVTYTPGEWYDAIAKPSWTPGDAVFGQVWTGLYVLIAIAGALVWTKSKAALANIFWLAQLAANGAWSYLFFGEHRIDAAMASVVVLFALAAGFIWSAWRVSRPAAILFMPYLAWVGLVLALNAHIWGLNGMPMGVFDFPDVQ